MTKTSPPLSVLHSLLTFVSINSTHAVALSLGMLITTACGDDFRGPTVTSSTDDGQSTSTSATPSQTNDPSPPNPLPTTVTPNPEPTDTLSDDDASIPMPPDAPGSDEPGGECGGEGQTCCDERECRRGLTCSSNVAVAGDVGVATAWVCIRDDLRPAPGGDAAPPAPPRPPEPEGDATTPPPPPGFPGDAAAPPPPPDLQGDATPPHQPVPGPEGDAAPPGPKHPAAADCGALGERCCAGPGARCHEGLVCSNPNGPNLDDSRCVTEE